MTRAPRSYCRAGRSARGDSLSPRNRRTPGPWGSPAPKRLAVIRRTTHIPEEEGPEIVEYSFGAGYAETLRHAWKRFMAVCDARDREAR